MEKYAQIIYEGLAFFMLFMAMLISTARAVHQMIPLYQLQSAALALITLITAIQYSSTNIIEDDNFALSLFFLLLFTLIPILLMLMVGPLLALASVPEDISTAERIRRLIMILIMLILQPLLKLISWLGGANLVRRFPGISNLEALENARRKAYPVWLALRLSSRSSFWSILLDLLLTILAFSVAYTLAQNNRAVASILAVSFSLLLLGLSIMRSKPDIISQIMGLLIMEHGMFLAAIRLITIPRVILVFVISLVLYIIITLTILVFLLPDLHRISGKIDISQQDLLKG